MFSDLFLYKESKILLKIYKFYYKTPKIMFLISNFIDFLDFLKKCETFFEIKLFNVEHKRYWII